MLLTFSGKRKPFFPIWGFEKVTSTFFCTKILHVRSIVCFFLFLFATTQLHADEGATGIVQGTITTTDSQPAAFVTVQLRGTAKVTITNEEGTFLLKNIKAGNYILEVSLVGLQPQQQHIEVKG